MVSTDGQSVVEEQEVVTPPAPEPTPPAPEGRRPKKQPPRNRRRRKLDPALIEFQPDAVEIEERPIPGKAIQPSSSRGQA